MFYLFEQTNSGGKFITNDKLSHRIYIEANSPREATRKAKELGCYFGGVEKGIDCKCCGDRWDNGYEIKLEDYSAYPVGIYDHVKDAENEWYKKYGEYNITKQPTWEIWNNRPRKAENKQKHFIGSIEFKSIEEYAQFMCDEYGTNAAPDGRIFYINGSVKNIVSGSHLLENI